MVWATFNGAALPTGVEEPEAEADVEGVRIEAAVAANILYISSRP